MVIKGFTPHTDQRRVIDAIENTPSAKYITLVTGRQWGKTLLGINLILKWALTTPNSNLMWVSPIYKQSKKVLDDVTVAIAGSPVVTNINKSELEIKFTNGSKILFRSAEREDNLRGVTLDYLIIDESAFIKDTVWDTVLKQTVLVRGKRVLFLSTPKGKNFLYNLHLRGEDKTQDRYLSLRGTSYNTPYITPEELDEARDTLPEDIFKQEILAEFIDSGGEVFKDIDRYCMLPEWSNPIGKKYYAGLDLGRSNDYTVLTILDEDGNVVYIYRDRHKPWNEIVTNVINHIKRYKATLFVEVNNVGDVIFEQIKNVYQNTYPFVTTNSSKQNIVEDLIYGLKYTVTDISLGMRLLPT
jgi:phage terminase large subunit